MHVGKQGGAEVRFCSFLILLTASSLLLQHSWLFPQQQPLARLQGPREPHQFCARWLPCLVGCMAEDSGLQLQQPEIHSNGDGSLYLSTDPNATVYVNNADIIAMLSQQQSVNAAQQLIIDEQDATIASLAAVVDSVCQAAYSDFDYIYNVSALGQGVQVDYSSPHLQVGQVNNPKWNDILLSRNGLVYALPLAAPSVLVIDPNSNTLDATSIPLSNTDFDWFSFVEADNGNLYFIPYNSANVLVMNITSSSSTPTTSTIPTGITQAANLWEGAVVAPNNGMIYCIPHTATSILIINPTTDTVDTTTMSGLSESGIKWRGGVLATNGLIYGIPTTSNHLLVINPMSNTYVDDIFVHSDNTNKWAFGVLAGNGKIYGIPISIRVVLVLDPTNNNAVSFINLETESSDRWRGGVLTNKGKIIGIPYREPFFLIVDPETGTADTTSLPAPTHVSRWSNGVFLPQHNRIYAAPFNYPNVLQIDLDPC